MARSLMPAFASYPQEGSVIGSLVVGYGELEIDLALLVRWIINDEDCAFRTLYGQRGESARITSAQTLTFTTLRSHRHKDSFADVIDAMKYCLKIRNQYAHSNWANLPDGLHFTNVENICQQPGKAKLGDLTLTKVSLQKLQRQERYFVYVQQLIEWLVFEFQREHGAKSTLHSQAPAKVSRPNL
jgi:hypothetical protein